MRLLSFVAVGIFWIGAYVAGGWTAVAIIAAVGVLGELALFSTDELRARRDRRVAAQRLEDMR